MSASADPRLDRHARALHRRLELPRSIH